MNLARLCARLKPVFLPKKGPSRARLLTKMSPSEELGTLNPRKTSPVFQGQLTTWGEKSLPGGNSPPLLYIALWGVEIPPPLTELSHGRGGEFTPPLYLVLWGMEIIPPPPADLSQGKQKDPLEKYAFIQQNFHFLPTRPFNLPGQNQLSTLRHSDI